MSVRTAVDLPAASVPQPPTMSDLNPLIVWVHGDNLNPFSRALRQHAEAPALFVWDEALLDEWRISLKRIAFIYECLLELPVTIRRGDVAAEIRRFAAEQEADLIVTMESPSPRFIQIVTTLQTAGLNVTILPEPPFLQTDSPLDLKRFSRYWRIAKKHLLK